MEKQTFTTTKEVKPDSVNIIQLQSCRFKPAFLNQFQSEMCLLLQQHFRPAAADNKFFPRSLLFFFLFFFTPKPSVICAVAPGDYTPVLRGPLHL